MSKVLVLYKDKPAETYPHLSTLCKKIMNETLPEGTEIYLVNESTQVSQWELDSEMRLIAMSK